MKKRKVYLALLVALILLAGCAKSQQEADYASERMEDGGAYYMYKVKNTYARPTYVNDMSAVTSAEMEDGNLQNEYDRVKKVIVKTEIMMETYEMEKTMETIMNSLSAAGGYVQSSQEGKRNYGEKAYRRYANMVLRVPADRYDEFMASSKEAGNIISQSTDSNDITESYYNLEAQIESLKLEEERVKQFYARAKDIDELLRIE